VTLLHDFTVTENYYVLVEGPIKLDFQKFLGR
jgi:carotenoid cleavage dioxygenase-like enzyme